MRPFFSTMRMCLRQQSYWGLMDVLGGYALRLARLVALLAIWRALAERGADLDGMTLDQLLSYTVLSTALEPLLSVRTPASSWLHEGTMLGLYVRPSRVFAQLIAHTMGGWLMPLLAFGAPVLLASFVGGVPLAPRSDWFYLSLPLSVAQGFAVDFLYACLLIRMRGLEWTVHCIREALSVLLTGALIPFALLPWGIGEWLALSPLGTLAGAPLALFSGLSDAARILPAQIFWTVTLWPLALWCYGRSSERMISYGG